MSEWYHLGNVIERQSLQFPRCSLHGKYISVCTEYGIWSIAQARLRWLTTCLLGDSFVLGIPYGVHLVSDRDVIPRTGWPLRDLSVLLRAKSQLKTQRQGGRDASQQTNKPACFSTNETCLLAVPHLQTRSRPDRQTLPSPLLDSPRLWFCMSTFWFWFWSDATRLLASSQRHAVPQPEGLSDGTHAIRVRCMQDEGPRASFPTTTTDQDELERLCDDVVLTPYSGALASWRY